MKYRIIMFFLHLVALLPFRVLFIISDGVSWLLYRVFKYRVDVVRENLHKSFPEKTEKEIRKIEREYYRHLCDCALETVKLLHISDKKILRHVQFKDINLLSEAAAQGKSIVMFLGHYGNWEWVPALTMGVEGFKELGALYEPLHDPVMDKVMKRIRSRFKSECISAKNAYRDILKRKNEFGTIIIGFIGDQRPLGGNIKYWTKFMGQPTCFVAGGETIGNRIGAEYFYADVQKTKRGHYLLTFIKMDIDNMDKNTEFPYTHRYFELLEQSIRRQPPYWLWTHKRWLRLPDSEYIVPPPQY